MKSLIKTSFCVFGIGACGWSMAQEPDLGWDPFAFTSIPNSPNLNGASGGELVGTWNVAWVATTGSLIPAAAPYNIVTGSIGNLPSGYDPAPQGNSTTATSGVNLLGDERLQRVLPTQAISYLNGLSSGQSMWISFLTSSSTLLGANVTGVTPFIVGGDPAIDAAIPAALNLNVTLNLPTTPVTFLNAYQVTSEGSGNYTATYYPNTTPGSSPTGSSSTTQTFTLPTNGSDITFGYDIPSLVGVDVTFGFDEFRIGSTYALVTTPEPTTLAGLGLAAVGYWGKKRRKATRNKKAA